MRLNQSPKFNINYCAKIVQLDEFSAHPNPKCTRLKCAHVDGYTIAVGIDTQPGIYIYFPIECRINSTFLSANNLFRDKNKNVDKEANPGFFEDNGRVRIIRLQQVPSEGFIMPVDGIYKWLDFMGLKHEVVTNIGPGAEFDALDNKVLVQKYVVKRVQTPGSGNKQKKDKQPVGLDKLVENQFRFHYNTVLIKKCPWAIGPDDLISITTKVHGTSGISAIVLCARPLGWRDKIAGWLSDVPTTKYDDLWSSRNVVKNQFYNKEVSGGYYGCDIWGIAHKVLKPHLTKGITLYYEIIGYLPTGVPIQSLGGQAYDYGYTKPVYDPRTLTTPFEYGTHYGIKIYRITYTNLDGIVFEFSARQVQQWCKDRGLIPVTQLYYGYVKDLYPDLNVSEHWNENFITRLANDKNFYMEELSPECQHDVPHEGVVIRNENGRSEAFKLKCIRFLEGESKALDKGEIDIESEQE